MKRTMELENPIYYGGKCEVSAFVFLVDFERYTQFKETQTPRKSCFGTLGQVSLMCWQGATGN